MGPKARGSKSLLCRSGFALFLIATGFSSRIAWAKFDKTTAGEWADSKVFGGMSLEELNQLQKMKQTFLRAVYDRILKFEDQNKSSADGGTGFYSAFGEGHFKQVNGMVSHADGANGIEGAVERGALGSNSLSGEARMKKNKEVMDSDCKPTSPDALECINKYTGQKQKMNLSLSAALYDAGPAHGNGPGKDGKPPEETRHRSYGVKAQVRTNLEKNAKDYAKLIIQGATKGNKQMNIDMAHAAYSKLEQDKYVALASDAFALKSARLEGIDTARAENANTAAEYKQIALDTYADKQFAGNVKGAEKVIQTKLADRIAEKKVVNPVTLCEDGNPKPASGSCPPATSTTAEPLEQLVPKMLAKFHEQEDGTKGATLKAKLDAAFPPGPDKKPATATLADAMAALHMSDLGGVLSEQNLAQKYAKAKNSVGPDEQAKIPQYKQRLVSNKCLEMRQFCFSTSPEKAWSDMEKPAGAAPPTPTDPKKIDEDEFKVVSGDPGAYFTDTRERLFAHFADAYNRPLSQWKQLIDDGDFKQGTDKNIKERAAVGLDKNGNYVRAAPGNYAEFAALYQTAMNVANDIHNNNDRRVDDAYKSAGAETGVTANYKTDVSDPNKRTFMELFGQNKQRDAVSNEWRVNPNDPSIDPAFTYNNQPLQQTPVRSIPSNGAQGYRPIGGGGGSLSSALNRP